MFRAARTPEVWPADGTAWNKKPQAPSYAAWIAAPTPFGAARAREYWIRSPDGNTEWLYGPQLPWPAPWEPGAGEAPARTSPEIHYHRDTGMHNPSGGVIAGWTNDFDVWSSRGRAIRLSYWTAQELHVWPQPEADFGAALAGGDEIALDQVFQRAHVLNRWDLLPAWYATTWAAKVGGAVPTARIAALAALGAQALERMATPAWQAQAKLWYEHAYYWMPKAGMMPPPLWYGAHVSYEPFWWRFHQVAPNPWYTTPPGTPTAGIPWPNYWGTMPDPVNSSTVNVLTNGWIADPVWAELEGHLAEQVLDVGFLDVFNAVFGAAMAMVAGLAIGGAAFGSLGIGSVGADLGAQALASGLQSEALGGSFGDGFGDLESLVLAIAGAELGAALGEALDLAPEAAEALSQIGASAADGLDTEDLMALADVLSGIQNGLGQVAGITGQIGEIAGSVGDIVDAFGSQSSGGGATTPPFGTLPPVPAPTAVAASAQHDGPPAGAIALLAIGALVLLS